MVTHLTFRTQRGVLEEAHSSPSPTFAKLFHSGPITTALLALKHANYLAAEETNRAFLQLFAATATLPSIVLLH